MSLWLSMAMLAAPSQPPPPLSSSSSSSSPPQPPSTWARGGDVPGPPAPVGPAVPPSVATALTGLFTGLYGLLFLCVYLQLWLVLRYRYKRFSFQTVFLALCLLWAGLRATLFVFYFENCQAANRLGAFAFWLLYCCPVCLQFFTLCLLNLYFSQMVIRAKSKHAEEQHKNNRVLRGVLLLASLLFLAVNVSCAVLVAGGPSYMVLKRLVLLRVLVNDVLFVACAVGLAICIWEPIPTASLGAYRACAVCTAAPGAMAPSATAIRGRRRRCWCTDVRDSRCLRTPRRSPRGRGRATTTTTTTTTQLLQQLCRSLTVVGGSLCCCCCYCLTSWCMGSAHSDYRTAFPIAQRTIDT
ncbi:integral membrane protein GPR137C isoform X2 [Lampetra fluviatilis]